MEQNKQMGGEVKEKAQETHTDAGNTCTHRESKARNHMCKVNICSGVGGDSIVKSSRTIREFTLCGPSTGEHRACPYVWFVYLSETQLEKTDFSFLSGLDYGWELISIWLRLDQTSCTLPQSL